MHEGVRSTQVVGRRRAVGGEEDVAECARGVAMRACEATGLWRRRWIGKSKREEGDWTRGFFL